jgi:NAD-dependent SIR2 family protein deacetylase
MSHYKGQPGQVADRRLMISLVFHAGSVERAACVKYTTRIPGEYSRQAGKTSASTCPKCRDRLSSNRVAAGEVHDIPVHLGQ